MQKSVVAVIINVNIKTFISKKTNKYKRYFATNRYVFATQSSHFNKVLFLVLVRERKELRNSKLPIISKMHFNPQHFQVDIADAKKR